MWLHRSMWFNFHIYVDFLNLFLLLVSCFFPYCLENILGMISVLIHLLRLVLQPSIRFVVKNIPCAVKKNVYFAVIACSILQMSVRSFWFIVLFKSWVSLLMFCLVFLSTIKTEILKSPTITAELFLPVLSVFASCMLLHASLLLDTYVLKCSIFLMD